MHNFFGNIYASHTHFWTRERLWMAGGAVFLFCVALIIQHYAYLYIDNYVSGTHVGDLLLDNLPVINLDFVIVQGALAASAVVLLLFLRYPQYIPFAVKTLAVFIIIRSFFISLTHLGVNLYQIELDTSSLGWGLYEFFFHSKNDFFFSGHTGASFLFALIFWNKPALRYLFIAISVIFAVSMIFAHMHYSIDIFAAFFITHSIFMVCKKLFKRDWILVSI